MGELVAEVRHLLSTEAGTQDLRSQLAKNPELANKLAAVAGEAGAFPGKAPPPVLVEPSPEATRLEEAARAAEAAAAAARAAMGAMAKAGAVATSATAGEKWLAGGGGGGVPAKDPPPRKAPPPQLPAGCPPATSTATTGPPPLLPPPTEPKAPPASLSAASVNKIGIGPDSSRRRRLRRGQWCAHGMARLLPRLPPRRRLWLRRANPALREAKLAGPGATRYGRSPTPRGPGKAVLSGPTAEPHMLAVGTCGATTRGRWCRRCYRLAWTLRLG